MLPNLNITLTIKEVTTFNRKDENNIGENDVP